MMYANSFRHVETMTASGTTYSPWFDIAFANELYMYADSTGTGSPSCSVVVSLERFTPYRTASHTYVGQFTTITGDTTEEKHYYATGTKFGMRVRFKYIMTWSSGTSLAVYTTLFAKRV